MLATRDAGDAPNMKSPCQCPRIIAAGHIDVKSSSVEHAVQPCETAASVASVQPNYPLSWSEVADFRERLRSIPTDRAIHIIGMLERWIEDSNRMGRSR